jgi:hypothetical protein
VDYSHLTLNLKNILHGQGNTTVGRKLREFLQSTTKSSTCLHCRKYTRTKSSFIYGFSNYLCVRIGRNDWDNASNSAKRVKRQIKPEVSLDAKPYGRTESSQYNLKGGRIRAVRALATTSAFPAYLASGTRLTTLL